MNKIKVGDKVRVVRVKQYTLISWGHIKEEDCLTIGIENNETKEQEIIKVRKVDFKGLQHFIKEWLDE